MQMDFDVVIVGLGPTGGTLANLLAINNLSILILEKEASLYNLPRAVHFDDEVMRVFQTIGISDSLSKKLIINKGTKFLDENGKEHLRQRENSPKDYHNTLTSIKNIISKIEKKFSKKFEIGICHPGSIPKDTGLL